LTRVMSLLQKSRCGPYASYSAWTTSRMPANG
jgi:hypothetical protein